jgi:hypothetical protein
VTVSAAILYVYAAVAVVGVGLALLGILRSGAVKQVLLTLAVYLACPVVGFLVHWTSEGFSHGPLKAVTLVALSAIVWVVLAAILVAVAFFLPSRGEEQAKLQLQALSLFNSCRHRDERE